MGVAVGGLWHYFDDFDQVVLAAFEQVNRDTDARIESATGDRRGFQAVDRMMRQLLPLDEVTQAEAPVVVNFWGRVALFPALGAAQRAVSEKWRQQLMQRLHEAVEDSDLRSDTPVALLAGLLLALSVSQQVDYVSAGRLWAVDEAWETVRRLLAAGA